jgi:hypothetical protein
LTEHPPAPTMNAESAEGHNARRMGVARPKRAGAARPPFRERHLQ